ncbi:hypothetical protein FOXG_22192 [Fusarium oxysporum f. sp. lycopersici 4287]|uniref:Uncharacterized protein n=1 Tax=Fusarium oxysporum f. sp. lycopersici (strain 4287 / CBS 123668 / FGSC 9935 / NRRL 34936) TaxID=426428 RepID=A0A0J9W625_FUSO4|nr:uncharacterized protein FOXG_22192 [Fusarium oxysporum f. sp. lycopersici 4287]KNB18333.1 hypothetical protein FOXG_22192 [Fusarium oxysporum f. sp. lycopersici 4287]
MPHHRKAKHSGCHSQTILTPPEPYVEAVTFQCTLPTEEPAIKRITRPLPFADNISENLAWASAFIDRAAHLNEASFSTAFPTTILKINQYPSSRTMSFSGSDFMPP